MPITMNYSITSISRQVIIWLDIQAIHMASDLLNNKFNFTLIIASRLWRILWSDRMLRAGFSKREVYWMRIIKSWQELFGQIFSIVEMKYLNHFKKSIIGSSSLTKRTMLITATKCKKMSTQSCRHFREKFNSMKESLTLHQ